MKKFFIYAQDYNPKSGGSVVSHKLCHIITGFPDCEAYLVPRVYDKYKQKKNFIKDFFSHTRWKIKNKFFLKLKTHEDWNTPLSRNVPSGNAVAIYPEVTFGNPLNAKNVVRWFLHQPGYHTKEICYGSGELYFKFNSAIEDFQHSQSKTSELELKIIHYPIEHYNSENTKAKEDRSGQCYSIRKGKGKRLIEHDPSAILIDNLSHEEVASLFKSSKQFISYDPYTAYSIFSVLCGCESVVVPEKGKSKNTWYPLDSDRYGIAYGLSQEELQSAEATSHLVFEHVAQEHKKSIENAKLFTEECTEYFSLD